ncbi:MAG: hypothetical protein GC190_05195 [Alphaproteobacteria bacterium]|nr:hypothetical protein [Alphaproteobacteria bacterium]
MKKILLAAATAAVLALGFGAAPASAAPNWSEFCKANGDLGVSHGECTSAFNGYFNKGQGNNDAAAVCKAYKASNPAGFDAAFGNVGKCIKAVAPFLPG